MFLFFVLHNLIIQGRNLFAFLDFFSFPHTYSRPFPSFFMLMNKTFWTGPAAAAAALCVGVLSLAFYHSSCPFHSFSGLALCSSCLLEAKRPALLRRHPRLSVKYGRRVEKSVRAILTPPGISPPSDKRLMSLTCSQNRAEFQGPCCRLFFLVGAPLVWRAHTRHDCTLISQHALSFRFPITQAAWKNLLECSLVDDLFAIFLSDIQAFPPPALSGAF